MRQFFIPSIVILLISFAVSLPAKAAGDELPPSLEDAIKNTSIPMIVDATILRFNEEGHAELKINTLYKPQVQLSKLTPREGLKDVQLPVVVRGYAMSGKSQRIVPMKILANKGKTRYLMFLKDDLLFSTYNNRFEIRSNDAKQLEVHTGRAWKPLAEITKLIPLKTVNANGPPQVAVAIDDAKVDSGKAGELAKSLKKWQAVKKESGGNYSYKIRFSSFVGFGHETEIVVRMNKVAERRYREFNARGVIAPPKPGEPAKKPEGISWTEKGKKIGSHKKGAKAKTLDQLYVEAAAVLKKKANPNERLYLRFDKQGLLLSCFTVDIRIADDAPRNGVMIASIKVGDGNAKKVYRAPNGKAFPASWGAPPRLQTRDLRPLPGGYGRGSGTLARWIQGNLDRDMQKKSD
jgi:hypothetical protein